MSASEDLKSLLFQKAQAEGFDIIKVTKPDAIPQAAERLEKFVSEGYHGDMSWMEDTLERRKDPRVLWPDVQTIIILGSNYGPDHSPLEDLEKKNSGVISVYARGKDYHDIIKKKLKKVASWIHQSTTEDVKVFVDTAPVMEKPLAQSAGLGWQGKHTNLVSRQFGSWLFLGSIFTTAEIATDQPEQDHCGSCQRCIDICPTNAFPKPYTLDARRCLAYLTIEHKGPIPEEFRKPLGNRVFGCDDCLAICPWNKYAKQTSEIRFQSRIATDTPDLNDLLDLTDESFRKMFAGTPVKRTGYERFMRNVLIAVGNSNNLDFLPKLHKFLESPFPLIRAMAIWAHKQLLNKDEFQNLSEKYIHEETNEDVKSEWK